MMTFVSMSITAYATHLFGAAVVGLAIGAGIVYAVAKMAKPEQVNGKEEPVTEQKQLLILQNNC